MLAVTATRTVWPSLAMATNPLHGQFVEKLQCPKEQESWVAKERSQGRWSSFWSFASCCRRRRRRRWRNLQWALRDANAWTLCLGTGVIAVISGWREDY